MARPRSFDEAEAIRTALHVFIEKGYDGASIADLTAAIGIKPGSLYAAFGDKRGLFERAMDLYAERRAPIVERALARPDIEDVVNGLLHDYVDALTDGDLAPGCLYVQAALSSSDSSAPIRQELARRRFAIEPLLEQRFLRAIDDGELAPNTECVVLARYIATLMQGMAVQASGGATAASLHAVAKMVSDHWAASRRARLPRSAHS